MFDDVETPNMYVLARGGVRMTGGYCTATQCVPSRDELIGGQYQTKWGLESSPHSKDAAIMLRFDELETDPERLQKAGYDTEMVGKWHLGPNEADTISTHGFEKVFFKHSNAPGHWNMNLEGEDVEPQKQKGGGVTSPFIVSWPNRIQPEAGYDDQPLHITDVLSTLMELAAAEYPDEFGGKQHPQLPGRSFASVLTSRVTLPATPLYFSLFNNVSIVDQGRRRVTAYDQPWQLYELRKDRTETTDLPTAHLDRLKQMLAIQRAYESREDVRLRLKAGEREPEYAEVYRADGRFGPGSRESVADPKAAMQRAKSRSRGMDVR